MKKVVPKDGYRAKLLIVKDEVDDFGGNLRIIGTETDQSKLKTELTEKVLKLSAFDNLVKKRKMSLDVESNQRRKCARRTSAPELFLDAWNERLQAEIAVMEIEAKQLQAEMEVIEPEAEIETIEMLD